MTNARPAMFSGPQSLRVRGERATLLAVLALLPVTVVVLGFIFQHAITWQQAMLLLVVAMVYVTLSRGRLLGGGLRVHAGQFGEVYGIVESCARQLDMATPQVFVRDDPFVPIVGVGIGEPYAVIISGQYLEHLKPAELRFLIGRELGAIASGHARLTSILSANGRENAVVSIAFGPWLRRIEYTADRVGLLCCGSLDAAISAIAVQTLHSVGRRVDLAAFADQRRELEAEPILRAGEWLAPSPYATYRIAALQEFARTPLYVSWLPHFNAPPAPGATVEPPSGRVLVGPWRRLCAFLIDSAVVSSIVTGSFAHVETKADRDEVKALINGASPPPAPAMSAPPDTSTLHVAAQALGHSHNAGAATVGSWLQGYESLSQWWNDGGISSFMPLIIITYAVALVGMIGRTVGMLLCDVRVVGADGGRVGFARALLRYACAVLNVVWIPGWFSVLRRTAFYDRLSGTRLVAGTAPALALSAVDGRSRADAPPPAAPV